jgi:hypothetical protein
MQKMTKQSETKRNKVKPIEKKLKQWGNSGWWDFVSHPKLLVSVPWKLKKQEKQAVRLHISQTTKISLYVSDGVKTNFGSFATNRTP